MIDVDEVQLSFAKAVTRSDALSCNRKCAIISKVDTHNVVVACDAAKPLALQK